MKKTIMMNVLISVLSTFKGRISVFLVLFFASAVLHAQNYYTTVDTLNCINGTPTFIVDLSANPNAVWTSVPMVRDGDCCGTDNNCVQFVITLHPQAQGILFSIPTGCGASPSGSLFYQVDCGPLTSVGTPLCLTGPGPFVLTFCKPGNNANCYTITSIPEPASGGDIITADGCQDTLTVMGLNTSSITWNSISPGTPGQFNNYLNNLAGSQPGTSGVVYTGQSTVIVTPQPGYPSVIHYQVCGNVIGGCSSAYFCDTVSVSIFPNLFADILPNPPTICNGSPGTWIYAVPIGGTAPYSYLWSTGQTTDSIFVTSAGVYSVEIWDATGCPSASDTTVVTVFNNDITADAGPDITICTPPVPTINLNGIVTGTTTGIWLNGTGVFSPGNTTLNATYTPSTAEMTAGFVELILETTNNGTCPLDRDTIRINLPQFTAGLSMDPVDIICTGANDGLVDLTVTGIPAPFTYSWSNGAVTEDLSSLPPGSYTVTVTDANGCTNTMSTTLTEPAPLLLDTNVVQYAGGYNISCFGASDGSIDLLVSGGTPVYTYNWSNGPVTEDNTGIPAGSYTVTVTDANGCTNTMSITLTEPAPLLLDTNVVQYAGGYNISCFGASDGSIDLLVSGGTPVYNYSWSNGPVTEDNTNIPAGSYTVTVTDANGCTNTMSITLTEPAPLLLDTNVVQYAGGYNISCFGASDGSIDLLVSGGTPVYNYTWSNGPVTEDNTGIPAGSYTVTVTDANGCTNTMSITLTEPAPLLLDTNVVQYAGGYNISCFGASDGSIDLLVSGGTPVYNYSWSNGPVTEDNTGIPAGSYTVTVTDANGCTNTMSITLTEPAPLLLDTNVVQYAGGYNISCFGTSDGSIDLLVSGGTPVYNYTWSNGPVTEDNTNIPAGSYTVTVTDANGCTNTMSITLTEPAPLLLDTNVVQYAGGYNISCFGASDGSIDLLVSGGTPVYTYNWSNGPVTEDNTNIPAGSYTVTVTDANGCTNTMSITLTEPAPLLLDTNVVQYAGGYNISCFGASDCSIDLLVSGGTPVYNYSWSNGPVTEDNTGIPAGSYTVTVTDANGCTNSMSITLTEPAPLLLDTNVVQYAGGYNISCFGASDGSIDLLVSGGTPVYNYSWSNGPVTEDNTGIPAGSYTVTVTDANGCTNTMSITLTEPAPLLLDTNVVQYAGGYNISCFGASDGSIDLLVSGGTPVYNYSWSNGPVSEDNTNIPAGSYTVTVTDANGCTNSMSITLTEPAPLLLDTNVVQYAGGYNISCFGASDGSIDLLVSGGTPVYTYNWSNGPVTEDNTGIPAGSYTVTVTDANGCTNTMSITLTEPAPLLLDTNVVQYAGGYNISCFGASDGSIDLLVSGGTPVYNYSWSNGPVTEDNTGIPAGSYTVTVTDANGCTNSMSITLTEPAPLLLDTNVVQYAGGYNISCFGASDGSIDLLVSGGTPVYNYSWSNGPVTEDNTGIPAGSYTVTVTDANGCTNSMSITLTEPAPLLLDTNVVQYAGGYNISCFGASDGSIDLLVSGGTPVYTYSWSNGPVTEDNTGIPAGSYTVTVTDANGCTNTMSITLTEPAPLLLDTNVVQYAGGYNISCFGASDGSIDLLVSGGTPVYNYSWSNGPVTEDNTNIPAGSYTVTVTDANGCTNTMSITLTEPAPLLLDTNVVQYAGGYNISCFGASDGSIDLLVSGGTPVYNYSWSNGPVTEDNTNIPAGSYTVTVTDANGCTNTMSITLTEPAPLLLDTNVVQYAGGYNISCFGASDGSIDLLVSGGTPVYNYSWSNGPVTEDNTGIPAGSYTVTVTDANGCTNSMSITLTEPPVLTLNTVVNAILCYGDSTGVVDITVGGGTPGYSYNWSNGAVTEDLQNLYAGSYNVMVTDQNGCTISDNGIIVTQPLDSVQVQYTVTPVSCNGGVNGAIDVTITGGTPGYTFSWSNGATTEDISGLSQGTYTLVVTDANGCVTDPYVINVTEPGGPLDIDANVTNNDCFGGVIGAVDITVTGGTPPYNYNWSNGANTEDLTQLSSGEYSVSVTDSKGCSSSDTYNITEPPQMVINADVTDNFCYAVSDASILIDVTGGVPGYTYSWSNGEITPSITNVPAGSYSLTVSDANGCVGVANFTVNPAQQLNLSIDSVYTIWVGESVLLDLDVTGGTGAYNYHWTPSDWLDCSDCQTPTATPYTDWQYSVIVEDIYGCADTVLVQIIVNESFYIPNSFTPNDDKINDTFRAYAPVLKEFNMLIFDRWGELIFETNDINFGWDGTYKGSECKMDVYVYKVFYTFYNGKSNTLLGHVNLLR